MTGVTRLPYLLTLQSVTVPLTNASYGNTYVFTTTVTPTFSFITLSYPFYVYVKNAHTSSIPVTVSNAGVNYTPTGPTSGALYPAASNWTGNSALTILYGSASNTWALY